MLERLLNKRVKALSIFVDDCRMLFVGNADIYFFRWIFHNWSDKYCIQILRNQIPALKKVARIVINDNVLLEPGTLPRWREERLRSMDLTMLELQNSRERELED